jgi:hypothetical protein
LLRVNRIIDAEKGHRHRGYSLSPNATKLIFLINDVGLVVGTLVGGVDFGLFVGALVGIFVGGLVVGLEVGIRVGVAVGFFVGKLDVVGLEVASCTVITSDCWEPLTLYLTFQY